MRFRTLLMIIGAIVVALTFAFPLWQPLLERTTTTAGGGMAGLPDDLQPVFAALPPDQQQLYLGILAQNPENAVNMLRASLRQPVQAPSDMSVLPSLTGPVEVGSGTFQRIDALRWGQGNVTVIEQVDGSKLLWLEDFSVANGPDLRVVLSASDRPQVVADIRQGDLDVDLGQLLGNIGNQYYEIPTDTDLTQYGSVVIYSPSVDLIYAFAPLTMRG